MGDLKIGWLAVGVLAVAILVVAVLVYARYRRDMRSAQERLESSGSRVVETDCGCQFSPVAGPRLSAQVVHSLR